MTTMTTPRKRRFLGRRRVEDQAVEPEQARVGTTTPESTPVDIAPNDPLLAYLQNDAVDIEALELDSPALRELKAAGVKLAVPLVSQGELIGVLNLGPRLSEQEYSSDDRKLLDDLAAQAAPALRIGQLVREQEAEAAMRQRFEQELEVAHLIQQHFLPKKLPEVPGWQIAAYYRPAREVGGDFYDVIPLPDGRIGFVVGDVTDKGVPAALIMSATRSLLRASAQRLIEPGLVLERLNDQMHPDMPEKMFVTCLYGVLDPKTGHLRFANAGHDVPYVKTADGIEEMRARGMPLGLMSGMAYEEKEMTLAPGDRVLLHSDGIAEAHDSDREMFGFPRLMETMADATHGIETSSSTSWRYSRRSPAPTPSRRTTSRWCRSNGHRKALRAPVTTTCSPTSSSKAPPATSAWPSTRSKLRWTAWGWPRPAWRTSRRRSARQP